MIGPSVLEARSSPTPERGAMNDHTETDDRPDRPTDVEPARLRATGGHR
ncbi:MAG: hypothetical protein ACI8U4_002061 [Natronomonas sp.]|jgi:hypothetical protein